MLIGNNYQLEPQLNNSNEYRYNSDRDCFELIITQRNGNTHVCLIDSETLPDLISYQLHAKPERSTSQRNFYAVLSDNWKEIYLHRWLMEIPLLGVETIPCLKTFSTVDHKNRVTMDNRLANLRIATRKMQVANRGKRTKTNG